MTYSNTGRGDTGWQRCSAVRSCRGLPALRSQYYDNGLMLAWAVANMYCTHPQGASDQPIRAALLVGSDSTFIRNVGELRDYTAAHAAKELSACSTQFNRKPEVQIPQQLAALNSSLEPPCGKDIPEHHAKMTYSGMVLGLIDLIKTSVSSTHRMVCPLGISPSSHRTGG